MLLLVTSLPLIVPATFNVPLLIVVSREPVSPILTMELAPKFWILACPLMLTSKFVPCTTKFVAVN